MEFRIASESDIDDIVRLAKNNDLLIDGLDEELYKTTLIYLYNSNPCGKSVQILCHDDGKIVGYYGLIAKPFRINSEVFIGGLASNLVVDKDFRASSVFMGLQNYVRKNYSYWGFDFLYGMITRPGVLQPHLRMGWKVRSKACVDVLPARVDIILQKKFPNRIFKPILVLVGKFFNFIIRFVSVKWVFRSKPGRVLNLNKSVERFIEANTTSLFSSRQIDYFKWRFFGFPERGYQVHIVERLGVINGLIVFRPMIMKNYNVLAIVDIIAPHPSARSDLFKLAYETAAQSGCELVAKLSSARSKCTLFHLKDGFYRTDNFFTVVTLTSKNSLIESIDPSNFDFTWFEHDTV